jgi:DNA-binding XRE family transcriptional regulator
MNQYITGQVIKTLREKERLTQAELAEKLGVSDKAVSKWETGKGYPDIMLMEPLASLLNISVIELLAGETIVNKNQAANMMKVKFYVCPICGNIITSVGEVMLSCCGVTLSALEVEDLDALHTFKLELVEDEYYLTLSHEMTKAHYISFIASATDSEVQLFKMYPESEVAVRLPRGKAKFIYLYCNKHGLFRMRLSRQGILQMN